MRGDLALGVLQSVEIVDVISGHHSYAAFRGLGVSNTVLSPVYRFVSDFQMYNLKRRAGPGDEGEKLASSMSGPGLGVVNRPAGFGVLIEECSHSHLLNNG